MEKFEIDERPGLVIKNNIFSIYKRPYFMKFEELLKYSSGSVLRFKLP